MFGKIKGGATIVGAFGKGLVVNSATSIFEVASHPIETTRGIGSALAIGAKGIGGEMKKTLSNPVKHFKEIKSSFNFIKNYWNNDRKGFKDELLNETVGGVMLQDKIASCTQNASTKAECMGEIAGMIVAGSAVKNIAKMSKVTKRTSGAKKMMGIKIIGGSTVSVGGQVIEDIGKWEVSPKEEYIGSAIGGGIEGLLNKPNSRLWNIAGSVTGNVMRESYIGNAQGKTIQYNRAIITGTITGSIPNLPFKTKNTSLNKQIQTKVKKGVINNFTNKTAIKIGIGEVTENFQNQVIESGLDIGYSYLKNTQNTSFSIGGKSNLKLEDFNINQDKLDAILSNMK